MISSEMINCKKKAEAFWAGRKTRVHQMAGKTPAFFVQLSMSMKELSVFVDESGDFGQYEQHSPFYIISLVMHR